MTGDGRTRSAGIVVLALLLGLIGATWWMLGHTERAIEHATRAPRTGGVPAPGTDTAASPRRRVDPGGDESASPADGGPGAPGPTVVSPVAHVITVVDPAGRPVAGAFLFSFTGEHVTGEGHTDTDGTAGWALGNDVLQMAVFARGWPVVVQTLAPGQDHRIELPRGAVVEGLVRVDGAPPTPDFELALRPSPPVTRYGDLPSHVRRHLRGSGLDPARMQAIVDEQGRFRVAGLPDATTCVFVAARPTSSTCS